MQTYVNTQYCNSGSKKNRYGVRLTVVQNSQSIENNTSNVTVTFELGGAGALGLYTDYTGSSFNSYSCTGTIYVNGVQKVQTTGVKTVNNNTVVTLATWTDNIPHNADGSLSIPISGTFTGGISSQTNGGEAGGTVTFDVIPRASSVSCTNANIGANPTFTITRKAQVGFTHTLKYSFGSLSETIASNIGSGSTTTGLSYSGWTIPPSFYGEIPNSTSGTCTIICETYNGTAYVGTDTTTFTVYVPSSAKPNAPTVTINDNNTISRTVISPDASHPVYVIGKSELEFTISNFVSNYSSTLKSYALIVNGVTYTPTGQTYTISTTALQTSNTYEVIVTDSRNRTATSGSQTFTAHEYSPPTCSISAERNSSTPSTINITYSGAITNINDNNRNSKQFKIEYRQVGSTGDWSSVTSAADSYTKSNVSVNKTNISESNSFDFRITATDSYGSATATAQVSTSATLLNFNANGNTMAFGKASESATEMEVAIPTDFQKPIKQSTYIKGRRFNASGSGYIKLFTITRNGSYYTQAMTFDIIQRGRSGSARIILKASTASSPVTNGFMLSQFYFEGNCNLYYLYDNSSNPASVAVYIQKSESNDDIEITNFALGEYNSNVVITWDGTRVSSVPTGYGSASRRVGQYQYGVTTSGTNNSDSNLMTSSGVKKAIINYVYPVGSFYYSTSSTNPNSTLGGTWVEKPCNKIISSGSITDTNLNFCTYKIYGNGEYEINGLTNTYSLPGATGRSLTINLPFTITTMVANISMAYGGNYYASTNRYCYGSGSTINIHEWNDAGGQADWLQDAFSCKGTLDLANNNLTRVYCFQRTA